MIFGNRKELTWRFRSTNPAIRNSNAEGEAIETGENIIRTLTDMYALEGNPAYLCRLTRISEAMGVVETAVLFSNTYGPKVSRHNEM